MAHRKHPCPECGGSGSISGTESAHGCDGTEEVCLRTCPIAIEVEEKCDYCDGWGWIPEQLEEAETGKHEDSNDSEQKTSESGVDNFRRG